MYGAVVVISGTTGYLKTLNTLGGADGYASVSYVNGVNRLVLFTPTLHVM
jgi:hypothetical protein